MHTRAEIVRRRSFLLIVPFVLACVLALSACGTNTTTGATPGSTTTAPVATATATQGKANADGCPGNTVVTTPPAAATMVLTNSDSGTTVNAKKGDIIEVNLPFGHTWQGPTNVSQNLLTAQGPVGYAYPSAKACVWRFLASGTGTAHLDFAGRPICQKGQACPMYVMAVVLTLDIK